MNRKQFIQNGILAAGALSASPFAFGLQQDEDKDFTLEEIKEFVFAAHNDFDKTKAIIEKKPLLLNCMNQAKKGDFESALGGASHMGREDIANLLVERGARMDIFSMVFLGFHQIVKDMIDKYPQYLNAPGPHGFTLLHHARVGKHADLVTWLEEKGLKEDRFEDYF